MVSQVAHMPGLWYARLQARVIDGVLTHRRNDRDLNRCH
jgi:hypothetical protein